MESEEIARSLYSTFLQVPEPRSQQGRRHSLAAALTLVVLASMDGADSLTAIGEWGRRQSPRLAEAMGFQRSRTSSASTVRNILSRIDIQAFVDVLHEWTWRNPLPNGVEIVSDPSTRLGFRVQSRPSDRSPLVGSDALSRGIAAVSTPTGKRAPTLRRWHRRI